MTTDAADNHEPTSTTADCPDPFLVEFLAYDARVMARKDLDGTWARKERKRQATRRYNASEKGRAKRAAYDATPEGGARHARYNDSSKGQERRSRYAGSVKDILRRSRYELKQLDAASEALRSEALS